ncbi:HAD family hydrolase [Thioclava sp. SK-1]|uniref:TIGR01459 family HAD-type hydrolase n=1 Tax=Thioclava sp. SK-1 TaxID=1889770 RepID=UPI000825F603|nr:TIGR01459 family HAD-type hydrolase [Thioclava sp. SK-1]OCX67171.1 HAD family hydrolase [Thioclava sp. SK-1]
MTTLIRAFSEISSQYDAVFCDLWGCLHNGVQAYPEAVAALRAFRASGGKVVLLTNAPRPAAFVQERFAKMNIPDDAWDVIVSSGDAAQDAMFAGAVGHKIWHLGPDKDDGFFTAVPEAWAGKSHIERVPLDEAEGIVCTGPFHEDTEVPDDYRATFLQAKTRGIPMLCANPDIVVDLGDRRIYCAGALAELYQEMGGEALYFGKPHPPIYDLARRKLAAMGLRDDARILALGDGVNTDVAGAAGEGIDCLFITGGLAVDEFGDDRDAPDPEMLRVWLAERQQDPQFTISKLR